MLHKSSQLYRARAARLSFILASVLGSHMMERTGFAAGRGSVRRAAGSRCASCAAARSSRAASANRRLSGYRRAGTWDSPHCDLSSANRAFWAPRPSWNRATRLAPWALVGDDGLELEAVGAGFEQVELPGAPGGGSARAGGSRRCGAGWPSCPGQCQIYLSRHNRLTAKRT